MKKIFAKINGELKELAHKTKKGWKYSINLNENDIIEIDSEDQLELMGLPRNNFSLGDCIGYNLDYGTKL